MMIVSPESLQLDYLDRNEAGFIAGVPVRFISNATDREIVLRSESGLFTLNNALEFSVIDAVSNGGSPLKVAKLVAAPAVYRMRERLLGKVLGTRKAMKVMVYTISGLKARGSGFTTIGTINASFCASSEIKSIVTQRLEPSHEVRVFAVDDIIENMMIRFTAGGGIIV